ncbi:MAG: phosphate acyltransferase PlsX [Acidobacteriota bacterium]
MVDAMGGDHAPAAVVEGAVQAARELPSVEVALCGQRAIVEPEVSRHDVASLALHVIDAPDVVSMDDSPVEALRRKKKSSLHVGAGLVRDGKAHGLVSAGNTGAVMTIYKVLVGTLPEVDRPALAACVPTARGTTVLLDVGANVSVRPSHLQQFAVMGHFYSQLVLGVASPRVGILSVGEEEGKGNELTREVYDVLKASSLNFVGNVEGRDIFNGNADVIVTDGFTGNVALKVSESVVEAIAVTLEKGAREAMAAGPEAAAEAKAALAAFGRTMKKFDYAEHGGAPLLGVRGSCIVCHGRSSAKAIKNGIRVAAEYATNQVGARIEAELLAMKALKA